MESLFFFRVVFNHAEPFCIEIQKISHLGRLPIGNQQGKAKHLTNTVKARQEGGSLYSLVSQNVYENTSQYLMEKASCSMPCSHARVSMNPLTFYSICSFVWP